MYNRQGASRPCVRKNPIIPLASPSFAALGRPGEALFAGGCFRGSHMLRLISAMPRCKERREISIRYFRLSF
jgi:hypothetical protein